MIDLSFGLEYEVELKDKNTMSEVVKKFDSFLVSRELLDFSYSNSETTFRIAPNKTEVVHKIMEIFSTYYHFNDSTTHIHCDALSYNIKNFKKDDYSEVDAKGAILARIIDLTKYQVIQNKRSIVYDRKFNMINLREHFNTIEYRCFPVTFDSALLLWQLQELSAIHLNLLHILAGAYTMDKVVLKLSSEDIRKRKINYGNFRAV